MNQDGSDSKTPLLTTAHCLLLSQEECVRPCQSQSLAGLLESYGDFMETELLEVGLISQSGQLRNQVRHTLYSLTSPAIVLQ